MRKKSRRLWEILFYELYSTIVYSYSMDYMIRYIYSIARLGRLSNKPTDATESHVSASDFPSPS